MAEPMSIAVLIGSLRAGAFSRKTAEALIAHAPPQLACRIVEIGDLPLYNSDLDQAPPPAWTRFRGEIKASDAVLFVTPEYNRSIPGGLKNAIDVGSRPDGANVFDGKPGAVVSVTPYKMGAFGANHALRQPFVFLNMPIMQQPEAYIGSAGDLFDEAGALKNVDTGKFFAKFMQAFVQWAATIGSRGGGKGFEAFMARRDAIARDYVNGEPESLRAILTRNDSATFFSPRGDSQQGAAAIADQYAADAKSFSKPGLSRLEVLQSGASGDLAFWTGLQHAEVRIEGKTTPMTLRITEVFRFEDGDWKLAHRHADMAKPG